MIDFDRALDCIPAEIYSEEIAEHLLQNKYLKYKQGKESFKLSLKEKKKLKVDLTSILL